MCTSVLRLLSRSCHAIRTVVSLSISFAPIRHARARGERRVRSREPSWTRTALPLPGSAVTIDGTRLGATTDADGHFVILQIPPGEMSLSAQLIGYRVTTVRNVRVNADRTTVVNSP